MTAAFELDKGIAADSGIESVSPLISVGDGRGDGDECLCTDGPEVDAQESELLIARELGHDVALSAIKSVGVTVASALGLSWIPVKVDLEM